MYKTIDGVLVWGDLEANALSQMVNCKDHAVSCALMADHHQGYAVPIGGVIAYKDKVSPSGVGFDIGCGNKAILLDANAAQVRRDISKIMDQIFHKISFGVGRKNKEEVDHPLFEDPAWKIPIAAQSYNLAHEQLGTVGSGNHYVDIFFDEEDRVWAGVHFGSRGLGHRLATYFIEQGGGKDGMNVKPVLLDVHTSLGSDYVACMELAGRYAYAGRDWVCQKVADILGANILSEVHNHHNFAWREEHQGSIVWVVRKGATPAFPGQKGFVGGSMGDHSYILEGIDGPESIQALYSTVHGAGRVMSRTEARGKMRWQKGRHVAVSEGKVSRAMMKDWIEKWGVELRGAGTDESPHCYKRIDEVLKHHQNTVRILHTLTPLGVAMAGEGENDPYKD